MLRVYDAQEVVVFLLFGCIMMSSSVGEKLDRRGGRATARLTWASRPGRSSAARRRTSGWRSRRPSRRRSPRSPCSTCRWPAGGAGWRERWRAEGAWEVGEKKRERERQRNKWRASDKWTTKTKSNEMKRADTKYRRGAVVGRGTGGGGGGVWEAQIFNKLSKVCSN